jgi:2-polyprenyl-3-methyl-5-hydroxy-6-metoxy-1,4-benzoquinol methylase
MAWRDRIGYEASALGQRLGVDWLTYNPTIMRDFDDQGQLDAPGFAARLVEVFGPVRYLDVGAATGRYTESLRKIGASAEACEHSAAARRMAKRRGLTVAPFDLAANPVVMPDGSFDVSFSLEVAEHIPPELGERLVEVLCRSTNVVFTAAHPGQGGTGHINEQPRAYWEALFETHSFGSVPELEERFHQAAGDIHGGYLLENLMIFRQDDGLPT